MEIVTCPTTKEIGELLRGHIADPLASQLNAHVRTCSRCIRAVRIIKDSLGEPNIALAQSPMTEFPEEQDGGTQLSSANRRNELGFLAPPVGSDEIGWLAHYRILKILGEGGMGIVLLGEDTHLERFVAIKVVKEEFNRDPEIQQRFMREARAMAQVKSDHVVTVYAVGQYKGTCYIAMELLEGGPLDSLLDASDRAPLSQSLRIGKEIAQALVAAHARGLVHRDIKPENVWLENPSGRVKLLDFGLARARQTDIKLTSSGIIIGTPAYMSPEQARAETVDERSDLFSLGCLIYELIAERPPFYGETVTAILLALAGETPLAPSKHNPDCPPDLDDLILRLLAKQPADRPQSARLVVAELEMIEDRLAGHAREDRPATPSNWLRLREAASQVSPGLTTSQRSRAREAERRQVTVLVCSCDLFESEKYLEQIDAEDQANILRSFQDSSYQAVLKSDGTVIHCNNEGLLACFGYPIAQEDAAHLASSTALTILEALTTLSEKIKREHNLELNPRIGVHTGLAIVETKGKDVSLVGEARSVAIRVKELTGDGQIVCSESTHRLLKGKFACTSLGREKIKGLENPVELFQVKGVSEPGSPIETTPPVELTPLTGRDQEMSLLKDRWEQAQEGMGQVVLLIGEAGLGKSRLVHAMKKHVRSALEGMGIDSSPSIQDSPIVEWRCSPHSQNTGLHPASSFFERILKFKREEPPAVRFDRLVAHLERYGLATKDVVPLLASLLSLPTDARFPSMILTPVREREETFRALKDWLRAYSSHQPVLFVVEDLHWLDNSTLEFLGQFLEEGLHDRILTLLTFRPEFRTPWPALSHQTSLALNRLTKRQVSELMHKKTGTDLPQIIVDKVYERSDGNPLFVEEFTRMMQESGILSETTEGGKRFKTVMTREIPATLQDLLMARLDRMEGDRELAQLAATLGREFSYELLAAVASLDEQTLESELTKLVQAEILYQRGRPPQSNYMFKHALVEDALYNSLVKGRRQQFHERIAQGLEGRFPQIVAKQPELIAHHLTEAGLTGESIKYWLSAGLRSQEQFANVEAICHLTKGLEALSKQPESPERDLNELLFLSPLGSAYQASLGYAAPSVGPTFERARELCRRAGQTSQLFEVLWGNWTWHLVRGDLKLCVDLAEEMMSLAHDTQNQSMIMEAYVAPAVTAFYRGEFAYCRKLCEEAITKYEDQEQCRHWSMRLGQNSAVVIRCYLSLALWHLGYPDQAVQLNEEMLALARKIGHPFSLCHGLHFTGWLYQNCRIGDKIKAAGEEEVAKATEQGFALWIATGTFFKGAGTLFQGNAKEALPLLEQGLKSFRAIAASLTLPGQLAALAYAYMKTGQLEQARKALDEGMNLAEANDDRAFEAELKRLNGELLLSSGDQSAAEDWFLKAIDAARQQQSKGRELRATISLARLWQEQGRPHDAQERLAIIYGAYKEGFTMPDLIEASDLLKSLE